MISKLLLPIGLQLLGIIIILAEFLLPSGGLLTLTAAAVFGYSLFYVFQNISPDVGFVFVGIDILLIPVLVIIGIKILARSPLSLKKSLSKQEGVTSQDTNLRELIGKTGTVINDLRPAGKALIDDKRFDVVSKGDYIDKDAAIIVTSVDGNRIVVEKTENN
jgi:membrane-bound serine protease (ClpP class)